MKTIEVTLYAYVSQQGNPYLAGTAADYRWTVHTDPTTPAGGNKPQAWINVSPKADGPIVPGQPQPPMVRVGGLWMRTGPDGQVYLQGRLTQPLPRPDGTEPPFYLPKELEGMKTAVLPVTGSQAGKGRLILTKDEQAERRVEDLFFNRGQSVQPNTATESQPLATTGGMKIAF